MTKPIRTSELVEVLASIQRSSGQLMAWAQSNGLTKLTEWRGGYPSGHTGTGGGGSVVEAAAFTPDPAADTLAALAALRHMERELWRLATATHVVRPAGCTSCARCQSWQPVFRRRMCRWCYTSSTIDGETVVMPPVRDVERHLAGEVIE